MPSDLVAASLGDLGAVRAAIAAARFLPHGHMAAPALDRIAASPAIDGPAASAAAAYPDAVLFAASNGSGASDAILRVGDDNGSDLGNGLARLFADNPAFNNLVDIGLDVDRGYYFVVDSDFGASNRILRGEIADLLSGTASPSLTQVFATDNLDNGANTGVQGEGIVNLEVDRAAQKIYWLDGNPFGEFEGGFQLNRANYDGSGVETVVTIDGTLNPDPFFGFPGGAGDFAIDAARGYAYVVQTTGSVDGLGDTSVLQNHVLRIDLASGAISFLDLGDGAADGYHDGRLDPAAFGQITSLDVDQSTGAIYFTTIPLNQNDHGGVFSYVPGAVSGDTVGGTLTTLWVQPADGDYSSPQSFPTSSMTGIEFDEVTGRYFVTASADAAETNASIFVGSAAGGAPTLFQQVTAPTADGAPMGMEIDYAATAALTAAAASFTEGAASAAVFDTVTLTDPDGTTLRGATVQISANFTAGDSLAVTVAGTAIIATYNVSGDTVTLSGQDTLAHYQEVLASLVFSNGSDDPTLSGTASDRTVSVTTFDGLVTSDAASVTFGVAGVNDAPVNTVPGGVTLAEDTAAGVTFSTANANALSVEDEDAGTLTVTLSAAHGTLTLASVAGLTFSVGLGVGAATMTFSGTADAINAALGAGLTYVPARNYFGDDAVTIITSDDGATGTGGALSDTDSVAITVTAVPDAPTTADSGATVVEDTTYVFSTDDFPFADADGDAAGWVYLYTVPASGTLVLDVGFGPTVVSAQSVVTYAAIAEGRLTFSPALEFSGTVDFSFAVGDTPDESYSAPATFTISVTAVDDAPVAVDDANATTLADAAVTIDVLANDTDVDGGPKAVATVAGTALVSAGDIATLASGATVTLAADGRLVYDAAGAFDWLVSAATAAAAHTANSQATDSFTYTLNGGSSATVTVTVNGVDGPSDELRGTGGDDQIRLLGDPVRVDGGQGYDVLLVSPHQTVTVADGVIVGFERVAVDGTSSIDLSAVTAPVGTLASRSEAGESAHIVGTQGNDTIVGGAGADVLSGGAGDDRVYLSANPGRIEGGSGQDQLIVRAGANITLTDATFAGFEFVRVEDGARLDLSGVTGRVQTIRASSVAGGGAEVIGTASRDHIIGGDGNDVLAGGAGNDLVTGGAGADTFAFASVRDFGRGVLDRITDFGTGQDTIDLSAIDADRRTDGDQAFTFLGTDAFTGRGGRDIEIRYEGAGGGDQRVQIDLNHDGAADYSFLVHAASLQATDFVL